MQVLRTLEDLRRHTRGTGVLVPTMGALHEGHEALIRLAVQATAGRADTAGAIVTIFVNPTQFNDPADFDRYPRTERADLDLCEASGASTVFIPSVEAIYPRHHTPVIPPLPDVATRPAL